MTYDYLYIQSLFLDLALKPSFGILKHQKLLFLVF